MDTEVGENTAIFGRGSRLKETSRVGIGLVAEKDVIVLCFNVHK